MSDRARLREVAQVFLKLGTLAFGGPAAHIGMMRDEVVRRRQWLSDQEFLDLLGAANLIPGPNSTEMTILLGARRAGWRGLIIGGACFILPAMLIVMVFGWLYVRFGSLPQVEWLLYGVKPVMIAIIAQAVWELGKRAVKGPLTLTVGAIALLLYALGVAEIPLLFVGGLLVMLIQNRSRLRWRGSAPVSDLARRLSQPDRVGGGDTVQLLAVVLEFLQDRRGVVRQRLRADRLHAIRVRAEPGLADQSTIARRHCRRADHAGAIVHLGDVRRLHSGRCAGGHHRHDRHLPPGVYPRRHRAAVHSAPAPIAVV